MENTSEPIMAIYENGILRPLTPLSLPEHSQVKVYVQPVSPESDVRAHRRRVHEVLEVAGLVLPRPGMEPLLSLLSPQRREELARIFSVGKPLSEIIIEEREDRF